MAATNVASVFGSVSLAVTATAASVTLPTGNGSQLLLQNDGTNTVFWVLNTTATAATIATGASCPIMSTAIMIFTIDPNATSLSAICATGNSTTLRITRCAGQ